MSKTEVFHASAKTTGFVQTKFFEAPFTHKAPSNTTTTFNLVKPIMSPLAMSLTINMRKFGMDWLGSC